VVDRRPLSRTLTGQVRTQARRVQLSLKRTLGVRAAAAIRVQCSPPPEAHSPECSCSQRVRGAKPRRSIW
jgi:hypothetical protein